MTTPAPIDHHLDKILSAPTREAQRDLLELAARVEALTGPDREVDVLCIQAIYPDIGPYQPMCSGDEPIFWNEPYRKRPCPTLTTSVDALLALIARELPGWWVQHLGQNRAGWGCRIETQGKSIPYSNLLISCATPALALLSAALRAKAAQQQMEADRG